MPGHYRIISPLGAGGMGEVFLASDPRLNRQVAIKLLPKANTDADARRRMLREARMVATIDHPNVCTIFEIGDDDGRPYIVMQYVQGETLSDRMLRGAMTIEEIRDVGRQVTAALAEAHSRGIVHRDIKPGNIMIGPGGLVKVLDFGLARTFESDTTGPTEVMISTPGLVSGTIPYMSPEQLRADPLDGRSDIFSLGIVLYEMLAGRRPFDRPTTAATITAILRDDPPPLGGDSEAMAKIIRRALAKPLSRRFPTAEAMREALERVRKPRRPKASGRPASAVAAAREAQIGSVAVLPLAADIADENLAYVEEGVVERIIARLSHLPRLRVIAHSTVMKYQNRAFNTGDVGRELGVQALITGRVSADPHSLKLHLDMAEAESERLIWSGSFERSGNEIEALAIDVAAQVSDAIRDRSSSGTGSRRKSQPQPQPVDPAAEKLYLRGRLQWNKRHPDAVRQAIASFQEAVEADPTYANAHAGLADAYLMLAFLQVMPPVDAIPKAKAAARRAIELDPLLAEPHASLGYAAGFMEWDWPVTEHELEEAMRLNPNYSWAPHWYGLLLAPRESFDKSLHYLTLARELNPLSPIITTAVGSPYHLHRRFDEAIRIYSRVLDSEPGFAPAHFYLGQSYEQIGRYEEAVEHFERAGEIARDLSTFIGAIGHCYGVSGETSRALAVLADMEKRAKERYVSPYHFLLIHLGMGNTEQALGSLEAALNEHTSWLYLLPRDPRMDPLRDNARFRELVVRYRLSSEAY